MIGLKLFLVGAKFSKLNIMTKKNHSRTIKKPIDAVNEFYY